MHGDPPDNTRRRSRRSRSPRAGGATSRHLARAGSPRARRPRGGGAAASAAATVRRSPVLRGRRSSRGARRARAGARSPRHVVVLVLDTGPLLALLDADDPDHARSVAMVDEAREDLVIPTCVLVEVDYWIH